MIRLNQLLATLSEAVLTFSELEALAESIAKDRGRLPIMSRLMSLWKEKRKLLVSCYDSNVTNRRSLSC